MKEQAVLIARDIDEFDNEVAEYLEQGWVIIPASLQVAVSDEQVRYGLVFEREKKE